MKKTFFYLLLLFSLILILFFINKNSESYFPIKLGKQKKMIWYDSEYVESFTDSKYINGEKYYLQSHIFENHTNENWIRKSNDTIYYWNDVQKTEKVFYGINPEIGEIIGLGVIKEVDAKLKTPKGELEHLLVIERNYSSGGTEIRYYQKELGLVAVKNRDGLVCYYIPE